MLSIKLIYVAHDLHIPECLNKIAWKSWSTNSEQAGMYKPKYEGAISVTSLQIFIYLHFFYSREFQMHV